MSNYSFEFPRSDSLYNYLKLEGKIDYFKKSEDYSTYINEKDLEMSIEDLTESVLSNCEDEEKEDDSYYECYKEFIDQERYNPDAFSSLFEEIISNNEPLFRGMNVEDAQKYIEKLKKGKEKTGKYWTISKKDSRQLYRPRYGDDEIVIEGRIFDPKGKNNPYKSINSIGTLLTNYSYGLDEYEIRFMDNENIYVEQVCVFPKYYEYNKKEECFKIQKNCKI